VLRKKILIGAMLVVFFLNPVWGQEGKLREYQGTAAMSNLTVEEARIQAIRNARDVAVEDQCGVNLQSETMVRDYMLSADFIHSISYGHIINEKIISEGVETLQKAPDTPPSLTYVIRMQVQVQCETGKSDPSFQVNVSINKPVFTSGEEMILTIKATKDCYITVLDFTAEDMVYILLPSQYWRSNFLRADSTLELPCAKERSLGINFEVTTPPGRNRSGEAIKVIATKQPIVFLTGLETDQGYSVMRTPQLAITELAKWLATVPLSDRAEAQAIFEVVKPQ